MAKGRYLFSFLLGVAALVCSSFSGDPVTDRLRQVYTSQIGVREKTGHNDGMMVETYLRYCGLTKGEPWCASFVCWSFGQVKVANPRSGYCPDLFKPSRVIWKRTVRDPQLLPRPGDIFGLYFPEKGRIAHTGFVDEWQDKYVITVEGNTNEAGSREGDGVYRKRRLIKSIYAVARYTK